MSEDEIRFEDDWADKDFTEEEMLGLAHQACLERFTQIRLSIESKIDRVKYYKDVVTLDELEHWRDEMRKTQEDYV